MVCGPVICDDHPYSFHIIHSILFLDLLPGGCTRMHTGYHRMLKNGILALCGQHGRDPVRSARQRSCAVSTAAILTLLGQPLHRPAVRLRYFHGTCRKRVPIIPAR